MKIHFFTCLILLGSIAKIENKKSYRILPEIELVTDRIPKSEVVPVIDKEAANELICNYEIVRSYGMRGRPTPSTDPHKYCPGITNNCCTDEDAKTAYTIWNSDIKGRMERYYQIYNYEIKYMFGYTPEGFLLARKYAMEPNLVCKQAANDYLSMNLNPKVTMHIFQVFQRSLLHISNIRKGFFCSICDANVQNYFKDFFATTNLESFSKLYFSKDFCLTLVEETIEAAFYYVSYVQRYLNNIVTLMNCKTGAIQKPQFNLKDFKNEDIKNCFFFRNRYFFYFCQKYCNEFSLVSASPILDGDVVGLKIFVDHFVQYRSDAFEFPKNNILIDGVSYEENFLVDYYPEVLRDVVWYRPSAQQSVFLDQMKTEVTPYAGIDPIPATIDSKFDLHLFGTMAILQMTGGLLVALLTLF